MAKTASDYKAEGRAMFLASKPSPGGMSWQARARQAGYFEAASTFASIRDAAARATAPVKQLTGRGTRKHITTVQRHGTPATPAVVTDDPARYAREEYMPHGTAAHIAALEFQLGVRMDEVSRPNYAKRAERLRAKIAKLDAKYSLRFARQTGDISAVS